MPIRLLNKNLFLLQKFGVKGEVEKELLFNFERTLMAHEDENNSLFDLVCICHLEITEEFILRNA